MLIINSAKFSPGVKTCAVCSIAEKISQRAAWTRLQSTASFLATRKCLFVTSKNMYSIDQGKEIKIYRRILKEQKLKQLTAPYLTLKVRRQFLDKSKRRGNSKARGRGNPLTKKMLSYWYSQSLGTKGKIYVLLPYTTVAEFQHSSFYFGWSWFFMASQLLWGFKQEQTGIKYPPGHKDRSRYTLCQGINNSRKLGP